MSTLKTKVQFLEVRVNELTESNNLKDEKIKDLEKQLAKFLKEKEQKRCAKCNCKIESDADKYCPMHAKPCYDSFCNHCDYHRFGYYSDSE